MVGNSVFRENTEGILQSGGSVGKNRTDHDALFKKGYTSSPLHLNSTERTEKDYQ